jgi:transcriptional regulator with XRE-family HTH domain
MESLGYSGYSLSKALSTSEAVISNIRNGKNPPNVILIRSLLNIHEELDAGWLLSGKGRMFRAAESTGELPHSSRSNIEVEGGAILGQVNERLERIEQLLAKMTALHVERDVIVDESISDLERTMRTLEQEWKEVRKDRHKKP